MICIKTGLSRSNGCLDNIFIFWIIKMLLAPASAKIGHKKLAMKTEKKTNLHKRTVFVFKSKINSKRSTTDPTTSLTDTITTTSRVL